MEYDYSPFRCRSGSKPSFMQKPPYFYICGVCGRPMISYEKLFQPPECCGRPAELIMPRQIAASEEGFDYEIIGGYDRNGIKAYWEKNNQPQWIWLHTFSGGQMRFIPSEKTPPAIFSLAEEDAYAYCDEDPCLECVFRCKRGFAFYFFSLKYGLVSIPLERLRKYWEK